jgi:hypothetical protein
MNDLDELLLVIIVNKDKTIIVTHNSLYIYSLLMFVVRNPKYYLMHPLVSSPHLSPCIEQLSNIKFNDFRVAACGKTDRNAQINVVTFEMFISESS